MTPLISLHDQQTLRKAHSVQQDPTHVPHRAFEWLPSGRCLHCPACLLNSLLQSRLGLTTTPSGLPPIPVTHGRAGLGSSTTPHNVKAQGKDRRVMIQEERASVEEERASQYTNTMHSLGEHSVGHSFNSSSF